MCIDNCFPKFLTISELFFVSKETMTANLAKLSLTTECKYWQFIEEEFEIVLVFPIVIFSQFLQSKQLNCFPLNHRFSFCLVLQF